MQNPTFKTLDLLPEIQQAIEEVGYTTPTPIQQMSIPILLAGHDLLGCAQTGTGKTAAFALPILNKLALTKKAPKPRHCHVLVLAPTRELAIQIHESFVQYGKHLRLKYSVVFGGVGQNPQVKSVANGVDVLIATPGRLLDLINQGFVKLSDLQVFVLDEADRMLDMGFIHDIKKVISMLPKSRHNLFFSATMPPEIEKLAGSILVNPKKVEVTPVATTAEKIAQTVLYVDRENKRALLAHVLTDPSTSKVIVFSRTKHGANKIVAYLAEHKITAEAIHGNKSQSARQKALENFKSGAVRVLVATDIAARGIDIDNITHVVNIDLPADSESYVHRIGRTARAGTTGIAISFCDAEEKAFLKDIEKLIGQKIPVNENHPFHSLKVIEAKMLTKGQAKTLIDGTPRRGGGGNYRNRSPRR